ncbi:MAG: AI-2E family transporter [Clostridia bacterium]|nr:AI-2E family transporter [Clostridia bacterium]
MKSLIPKEIRAKTLSNIIVVCIGIALAVTLLHLGEIWGAIKAVLRTIAPFLIGFIIAFLLMPIVNRVEKLFNQVLFKHKPHPKLSRAIATIIAYVVFLSLVSGFFAILVPQLITSVKSILQYIANFVSMNRETINQLLLKFEFLSIEGEQLVIAWENVVSQLMNYTSLLVNNLMAISSSIYTLVFQLLVGMIAAFYLLMEREKYCAQVKKLCYAIFKPSTCETLIYWTRRAHKIFSGFITGKILDSMIIGIICYVCMLLFRIEYPLLISVIVGFTNIVPFFGPLIGAIPCVLILLLINPLSALWFTVFILILQQLDGNVIGPFIMGDYVGLSPFFIMLAIMVGGGLFGFPGMLLGVPVFALIYAMVKATTEARLRAQGLPTQSSDYEGAPENIPRKILRKEDEANEASDI